MADSTALFERLMLEGMQAGLSWYTVLKKREHMRECFSGFDLEALAGSGDLAIRLWLDDPGLIRHRGKLEALIANARACLALSQPLAEFVWSFVDYRPRQNGWRRVADVPAATEESSRMSRALKKAGFRFVGPTTCYAFMQSVGMVNDHLVGCHRHAPCRDLGSGWRL